MPERRQLSRAKGWRKPAGAIVVSRPTVFGNPFPVVMYGHAGAAERYGRWLAGQMTSQELLLSGLWTGGFISLEDKRIAILGAIATLRGRDLLCWCPLGGPCHADVLLRLANA